MGITSGSRFNAARRLQKVEKSFNLSISLVSVAIIALTVTPLIYKVSVFENQSITFLTVAASVAIMVLTNINSSAQNLVIAEQLHRCALEVNEIARQLDTVLESLDDNTTQTVDFAKRYGEVLQKYSVNHDKVDYIEHKLHRRDEFKKEYEDWKGDVKVCAQSISIWWAHQKVLMFGLTSLVACGWLFLRVTKLV